MLDDIDARINALPQAQRDKGVVLVMHQMGSHGPAYFKRTPDAFKDFRPECESAALQSCELSSLINAYDNTRALHRPPARQCHCMVVRTILRAMRRFGM